MVYIPFRGKLRSYTTVGDLISELSKYDSSLPVTIMNEPLSLNDIKIIDEYYPGDTASPKYDPDDEIKVLDIG